jgi:hypothetical protein
MADLEVRGRKEGIGFYRVDDFQVLICQLI